MSIDKNNVVKVDESAKVSKIASKDLDNMYKKRIKKNNSKQGFIRVRLTSADAKALDKCAADLVKSVKIRGIRAIGPIPMPKQSRVWTLLTSPHIDKRARQQLVRHVRTRVIDLPASQDVMDAIEGNSIPSSVEIEVKT